jgi:hypothetical protein
MAIPVVGLSRPRLVPSVSIARLGENCTILGGNENCANVHAVNDNDPKVCLCIGCNTCDKETYFCLFGRFLIRSLLPISACIFCDQCLTNGGFAGGGRSVAMGVIGSFTTRDWFRVFQLYTKRPFVPISAAIPRNCLLSHWLAHNCASRTGFFHGHESVVLQVSIFKPSSVSGKIWSRRFAPFRLRRDLRVPTQQ